jgi:hypothetical protein
MLGVPAIKQYERYLGLPSFIGRAKYSSFAQIKERVWSKLKGWKEKLISQAGREVLIKSVAQAIPAYAMSCFRLPTRLIKEIEVLIRRFWWGQSGDKGRCIGCLGIHFASPKPMVESGLESWDVLMKLFLQNKFGVSCITHLHSSTRCSRLSISQGAQFRSSSGLNKFLCLEKHHEC